MKNIYQVIRVKNGIKQVSHETINADIDELHIVSMNVKRKELEQEMAEIERQNSFKEKTLPAIVFFGLLFLMGLVVLHSWRVI